MRNVRFSVVINGVEIVRNLSWAEIARIKEELKKLGFKWDGAGWRIKTYDPAVVLKMKQLLGMTPEEVEKALASMTVDTSGGAVVIRGRLPEELKPHVISSVDDIHLVSLSGYLREFVAKDKRVAQATSYEEFVDIAVSRLREILRGLDIVGHVEEAINNAREFVLSSQRLRELFQKRQSWRVAELHPTYVKVNFLASGLLKKLADFKMNYNVVGKDGELHQKTIRLVSVSKEGEVYIIRYPQFLVGRISHVLGEFGYIVRQISASYPAVAYRKSFSLYPFQAEAVDNWAAHGMRGTVIIPTGGGKTFVGLEAMYRAGTSALVLVVTKELAQQWAERIRKYLGVNPGLLGGGERDVRDVTVAIYNSAVKYINELIGRFGLVIFDEAHHVPAETFKEVALRIDSPHRLALSATPEREDQNEHLVYEAVGPPVYRASYRAMMNAGLVVPVEHYRIYVKMSEEERDNYRKTGDNPIILRNIAARASRKIEIAAKIARREAELGSKVLVFTQFIEQAEQIYRAIKAMGTAAELITSEEGDRDVALRRFGAGVSRIVVTTTVLDEGIDVPDADVAVIASGTGSRRQMIQRVGRIVRASPGKSVARVYEIVTRDTIEEALSEARHFDDVVEEAICKRIPDAEIDRLLARTVPLSRWLS